MQFKTADLCDDHEDNVFVAQPLFKDYGGNISFTGQIYTIKCFEDNSLVVKHSNHQVKEKYSSLMEGARYVVHWLEICWHKPARITIGPALS